MSTTGNEAQGEAVEGAAHRAVPHTGSVAWRWGAVGLLALTAGLGWWTVRSDIGGWTARSGPADPRTTWLAAEQERAEGGGSGGPETRPVRDPYAPMPGYVPSPGPEGAGPEGRARGGPGTGMPGGWGGGPGGVRGPFQRGEMVPAEEREAIERFITENMPNTRAIIDEFRGRGIPGQGVNRERSRFAFGMVVFQYRRYLKGKQEFPELESRYMQDVRDTDTIVGLVGEYREATATRQEEVRGELREKMRSLSVSLIEERRRRIERLRATLEREEKQLARDEARVEQGVESRLEEILTKLAGEEPSTRPSRQR